MGNNIDLCQLAGAPERVSCKICKKSTPTYLDDYDIDERQPEQPGVYHERVSCVYCNHEFSFSVRLGQLPLSLSSYGRQKHICRPDGTCHR